MNLDIFDTKPEPQNDRNRNFDKYQDNIQEKRKISQIPKKKALRSFPKF